MIFVKAGKGVINLAQIRTVYEQMPTGGDPNAFVGLCITLGLPVEPGDDNSGHWLSKEEALEFCQEVMDINLLFQEQGNPKDYFWLRLRSLVKFCEDIVKKSKNVPVQLISGPAFKGE